MYFFKYANKKQTTSFSTQHAIHFYAFYKYVDEKLVNGVKVI
jgi:hypothetical protein